MWYEVPFLCMGPLGLTWKVVEKPCGAHTECCCQPGHGPFMSHGWLACEVRRLRSDHTCSEKKYHFITYGLKLVSGLKREKLSRRRSFLGRAEANI